MKVADADYVMLYTCKNHDCYDNNVVLLWSGVQNVVYGKVYQTGQVDLDRQPTAGSRGRAREAVEEAVPVATEVAATAEIDTHHHRVPVGSTFTRTGEGT